MKTGNLVGSINDLWQVVEDSGELGTYLTVPDHADWTFGSGEWTVDFRAKFKALPSVGARAILVSHYASIGNQRGWLLTLYNDSGTYKLEIISSTDGGTGTQSFDTSDDTGIAVDTWYHIGYVRDGNVIRYFLEGVAIGSTDYGSARSFHDSTADLEIGGIGSDLSTAFNGCIDELRISSSARWTSGFTPSTSPYTSDANTSLLLHLNSNLTDDGNTGHTVTGSNVNYKDGIFGKSLFLGGPALTSYSFSNLDGDTDQEYKLITRIVNNYAGSSTYTVTLNADTATNYGYQRTQAVSTTASAEQSTDSGMRIGVASAVDYIAMSELSIYAKSGQERTAIGMYSQSITGTTITAVDKYGHIWNNTADNIISLEVTSSQTAGLGLGSRFILLKKVNETSGMKTGDLDVLGSIGGAWELIDNVTVPSSSTYESQEDFSTSVMTYVGDVSDVEWRAAQKIVLTEEVKFISGVNFYASVDNGSPSGNITVRIETDSSNEPSGTLADTDATVDVAVAGASSERTATFPNSFTLPAGTYWIRFNCSNQATGARWALAGDTSTPTYAYADSYSQDGGSTWTHNTDGARALYFKILTGDNTTSYTIDNLNGNTDVLYRITVRMVSNQTPIADNWCYLRPNNDSTSGNYGWQRLRAENSTVSANRHSTVTGMPMGYGYTADEVLSYGEMLIYAKSGYTRTSLINYIEDANGTSILANNNLAMTWTNTADEMTSAVVTSSIASGLGIGTEIKTWRLNL